MKRRGGSDVRKQHEQQTIQDIHELAASLKAQRTKAMDVGGIGAVAWEECIEVARRGLLARKEPKKQRVIYSQRTSLSLCSKCLKGLVILLLVLFCIGLFLYLCKPASFFLQKKLHSSFYPASRLARKGLLMLHSYLSAVGVNLFSSCVVKNPLVPDDEHCSTSINTNEWTKSDHTVPYHVINAARNGEWWILRSAINIDEEVTVQRLHQFSMDNAGLLPRICEEIVSGEEGSSVTAFYTDIFNILKMRKALKSPVPWGLSWIECPDKDNNLTLHSLLPPPSYLPPEVQTSSMSLMSLSTEWCVTHHFQGKLPSTLLSLVVVKGEVRVVPVVREEDCERAFAGNSIFLREGDAVLLDYHCWSYEVETWSNYSITTTSAVLS